MELLMLLVRKQIKKKLKKKDNLWEKSELCVMGGGDGKFKIVI